MKTRSALFLATTALFGGFVLARVLAQSPAKSAVPETSKVLFENERTRVLEYRTNGGKNVCGLGVHSHPPHVYIMLTDGKLRVVGADGKESIEEAKAGEAGWEPAVTHRAETVDGKETALYLIEFKDKDWKPSTGLSP